MKTYTTADYSLSYPQDWQGQRDTQGSGQGSIFSNPATGASLRISFAYDTQISLTNIIDQAPLPLPDAPGASVQNFHAVNVSKTVVVGRVVWKQ